MINLEIHSPEEEIFHPIFREKQIHVFLKRDDLIHPFISGNKWRKLKYPLRKAESENKKHLVTFGGVWSNHLLATACAAAKFGFNSTGFVRGELIDTAVLTLCRIFGMELISVERDAYRDKYQLFKNFFENDQTAFFIDEGGCSIESAHGCAELVEELTQSYQHVFVASGTGTTAAGIINGLSERKDQAVLHVVSALKGNFLKDDIQKLLVAPSKFKFHNEFHFGGYAKTTPQLIGFIKTFSSDTGILLDPVYTGKMMYAIFELAKQNYFVPDSKILAVHTGGVFGLLGMTAKFN